MADKNDAWNKLLEAEEEKERIKLTTNRKHIEAGVSFFDWKTAYIDSTVVIGAGTRIGIGVVITGETVIGKDCNIGHHTRIDNSIVGDGVQIENSVILKSQLGDRCKIGPFAYIRPDCKIGSDAKIGDFVEVKNSTLGNGSKASHLTYIGDADVGDGVNLGCGVVFVNYDGIEKHRSTVEDNAFIGCNSNLISPVTVGKGSYIAAGTTVTKDVPEGALSIGREKDRTIEGWVAKRAAFRGVKK